MTQRKRATGFALMDTAFAADAKFVRLARKAPSEVAFATAVGVYWLILADARRARNAAVNWDDYTEYTDQIALLKDAKLLTSTGFDPTTFDRWAPAYKSPWDKGRTGTQGDAEEQESTQATPTSTQLGSAQLKSVPLNSDQPDGYVAACELLGYFPNSDDFRDEMTALDSEYGAESVVAAVGQAFSDFVTEGTRPKPFDLKKAAHMILAEAKHRADKAAESRRRDELVRSMADDIARQEREAWEKCGACHEPRRVHGSATGHEFEVAA